MPVPCVWCSHGDTVVLETRKVGAVTWRRLRCNACRRPYVSREHADPVFRMPTKAKDPLTRPRGAYKKPWPPAPAPVVAIPEDLPGEQWFEIPGYVGAYEVSSRGRVRSVRRLLTGPKGRWTGGKILQTREFGKSDPSVTLRSRVHKISDLLARAVAAKGSYGRNLDTTNPNSVLTDRTGER